MNFVDKPRAALTLVITLTAVALAYPGWAGLPPGPSAEEDADGLIVKFRAELPHQVMARESVGRGIRMLGSGKVGDGRLGRVELPAGRHLGLMRAELEASGLFEYVEPDVRRYQHCAVDNVPAGGVCPNDPDFNRQWAFFNYGQFPQSGLPSVEPGADMDMLRAWGVQTGSMDVKVVVIDDGVDVNHPDLSANILSGAARCFATATGFCTSGTDANPGTSSQSHGTRVAGQIGARGDNNQGIAGVAWRVGIIPVRTDLRASSIISAIDHAIAEGAHIINASYGGPSFLQSEFDAIERARDAGILFVTSAGNSDTDNDRGRLAFPQTYDLENIVAVGAGSPEDGMTSWAQYGQTTVHVTAGGIRIWTTSPTIFGGAAYAFSSGSSFASPMVAGIAALIKSEYPGATWQEMRARIIGGADMTERLRSRSVAGRANAFRSLTTALDQPVVVIDAIGVDDTALGNGNGVLDAGEQAFLEVKLESLWGTATTVTGTLSLADPSQSSILSINSAVSVAPVIQSGVPVTLAFPVTVGAGLQGNFNLLMRLDLTGSNGLSITRWFRKELGLIRGNSTVTQFIGNNPFDEYHHYHVNVPAAATQFRIDTESKNDYDIDLLARLGASPRYQIALSSDPEDGSFTFACAPAAEVRISGREDGNERINWPGTNGNCNTSSVPEYPLQEGTYHLVVINFGQENQEYRLSASWCTAAGCPGQLQFSSATYPDTEGSAILRVRRVGGSTGPASVRLRSQNTAAAIAGIHFNSFDTVLQWADGETDEKTFNVTFVSTRTNSTPITFEARLDDPSGATTLAPSFARVTVPAGTGGGGGSPPPPPPPPPQRSGGGGSLPLWVLVMLVGLAVLRRRMLPA